VEERVRAAAMSAMSGEQRESVEREEEEGAVLKEKKMEEEERAALKGKKKSFKNIRYFLVFSSIPNRLIPFPLKIKT
jgi:hypothetical protein